MAKQRNKPPRKSATVRTTESDSDREDESRARELGPIIPFGELDPTALVRTLRISHHPRIPDGVYSVIDSYCTDPDCDCRVAYLIIVADSSDQDLAHISVGWEPVSFYQRWMGSRAKLGNAVELKGPSLMPWMPQGPLAPFWLELIRQRVRDREYLDFFKERYFVFKSLLV